MNDPVTAVKHVFLCYAREDSRRVDELEERLRAAGIRIWRDKADLWPGQDWRAYIRRAITEDALVFLACFSRQGLARRTRFQNEELIWAVEQMRLRTPGDSWLVPVRFDDCSLPDLDLGAGRTLVGIQRADLFGCQKAEASERLVAGLLQILGMASVTAARTDVLAATGLEVAESPLDFVQTAAAPARHDRMLELAGTDTAAMREITAAREMLLAQAAPDQALLNLLTAEYDRLARRNRDLPEKLPAVWIRIGNLQHAVDLARSIPDPKRRAGELAEAVLDARRGDSIAAARSARAAARVLLLVLTGRDVFEHEISAALDVADEELPGLSSIAADVLVEEVEPELDILAVVAALAQVGLREEAQEIAADLDEPGNRARALAEVAASLAADNPLRASRILAQAESAVRMIDRSGYGPEVGGEKAKRAHALADMAVVLAGSDQGHADRLAAEAEAAARDIADVIVGTQTVARIAKILAGTYPRRAARMAKDADRALSASEMPQHSRQYLRVAVATALAATSQCERAKTIACRIADADHKDGVLETIVRRIAETGQPDQAMDVAKEIASNWNRANAFTSIAAALTDTDPERAGRLAWDAATLARDIQ